MSLALQLKQAQDQIQNLLGKNEVLKLQVDCLKYERDAARDYCRSATNKVSEMEEIIERRKEGDERVEGIIQRLKKQLSDFTSPVDPPAIRKEIWDLVQQIEEDDEEFFFLPESTRENVIVSMLHKMTHKSEKLRLQREELKKEAEEKTSELDKMHLLCTAIKDNHQEEVKSLHENFTNLHRLSGKQQDQIQRLNKRCCNALTERNVLEIRMEFENKKRKFVD